MVAKRLILLGPPGAGKGTQSARLMKALNIPQISTGDILRGAIGEGSELGRAAKAYMDKGHLVPDEVVLGLVEDRLARDDTQGGYILDGFPRNGEQAKALDDRGIVVERVISLVVPHDVLVDRLCGRRVCRSCGRSYHTEFSPTQQEGICDDCGGQVYQRKDDVEEVIESRLQVYTDQTAPLITHYKAAGLLRTIEGNRAPQDVGAAILEALK
ncbi:adenylate kinase [Myxococcota bacterium]|nr:adenylate kinase [Myxococcota bacterium]MBU1430953.1 adenylate kinase [Myxococcota bacterium]MBU1897252.1 adenylate kinase [Myxococcota bacterium]